MDRREFVAASSAIAAMLTYPGPSAGFGNRVRSRDSVCVLFDRRFEPSSLFGRVASELTPHVHGIDGDVTSVWTEHLHPLWRRGSGTVAGMTTFASFICLQQLAAQYWFRVIALIEHLPGKEGILTHRVVAEPQWQQRLRNSLDCTPWPQSLGPTLLACGRRGVTPERAQFSSGEHRYRLDTPPLVSWYLAGRSETQTS
jgi:hypothetical protein